MMLKTTPWNGCRLPSKSMSSPEPNIVDVHLRHNPKSTLGRTSWFCRQKHGLVARPQLPRPSLVETSSPTFLSSSVVGKFIPAGRGTAKYAQSQSFVDFPRGVQQYSWRQEDWALRSWNGRRDVTVHPKNITVKSNLPIPVIHLALCTDVLPDSHSLYQHGDSCVLQEPYSMAMRRQHNGTWRRT